MNSEDDNILIAATYRMMGVCFVSNAKFLHEHYKAKDESMPRNLRAIPYYYLLSHACELFLKAALLKRGVSEAELRKPKLRHDLAKLAQEVINKGVGLSSITVHIICALNAAHHRHALRYTAITALDEGPIYTPQPEQVYQALDELLMATRLGLND
jgi:hypothetical protein